MAKPNLARRRTAEITPEQLLAMAARAPHLFAFLPLADCTPAGLPKVRAFRAKFGRRFTLRVSTVEKNGLRMVLLFRGLPAALLEDLPA